METTGGSERSDGQLTRPSEASSRALVGLVPAWNRIMSDRGLSANLVEAVAGQAAHPIDGDWNIATHIISEALNRARFVEA